MDNGPGHGREAFGLFDGFEKHRPLTLARVVIYINPEFGLENLEGQECERCRKTQACEHFHQAIGGLSMSVFVDFHGRPLGESVWCSANRLCRSLKFNRCLG